MSESLWIHSFTRSELALDRTDGSAGVHCLVSPDEARKIISDQAPFSSQEENIKVKLKIPQLGESIFDVDFGKAHKDPTRTEHRLYMTPAKTFFGEEPFRELISPEKIGCFFRKNNIIHLVVLNKLPAYDLILREIRSNQNNAVIETVLESNANQYEQVNHNTIYYGAPGTGKSHKIIELLNKVDKDRQETITFHPDYDYTSFVGGYRPISVKSDSGEDSIQYKFVPQVFTNMYVKAWQNNKKDFYLIVEEINRGNCAEIFGDIFQLLDQNQKYTVTPSSEMKDHLFDVLGIDHEGIVNGLKMPPNLIILATMNTSDQSLFPMDSAFKRRWDWEYIPINYVKNETNPSSKFKVYFANDDYFSWIDFIKAVNTKIKSNPNLGMDKCIGNYFIKPNEDSINLKTFINKAVFYLWNDVFKDEFGSESIFSEEITYEDFFPIESNGESQVRNILKNLNVEIVVEVVEVEDNA